MSVGYGMHPGKEHYLSDKELYQWRKEIAFKKYSSEMMRALWEHVDTQAMTRTKGKKRKKS
jgi:hypothetical protein